MSNKACVLYSRMKLNHCFCDSLSIEEQERLLQAKAEERGFVVQEKIRVNGEGSDIDAFGMELLQQYMADNGVNTVMVTSYEAFSEDAFVCKDIVESLKQKGVEVEPMQECSLRVSAEKFFQMS